MDKRPGKRGEQTDLSFASRRELFRFGMLVILAVITGIALYSLSSTLQEEEGEIVLPEQQGEEQGEDPVTPSPASSPKEVPPFRPEPAILEKIEDDKYFDTQGYFYLLHQVMSESPGELKDDLVKDFKWQQLTSQEQRDALRGKSITIEGRLVGRIKKYQIKDSRYAKERGIAEFAVWRGGLYTHNDRFFLFVLTDFPKGIRQKSFVRLTGRFFKVWFYESQGGDLINSPVIIGKTLHPLPLPESAVEYKWATFILLVVFAATCIFLGFAIFLERKEMARFRQARQERKNKKKQRQDSS